MGQYLTYPHLWGGPDPRVEPIYEPLFGFPKGRKPRLMLATVEEMDSANVEPWFRDYCAHRLIKYRACKNQNWPLLGRCKAYRHAYEECLYQE